MTADPIADIEAFFRAGLPAEWFAGPVEVRVDRDEILVTGTLPATVDPGAFREHTRQLRVRLAEEAQGRFLRRVSWAVRVADDELRFTTVSVPVMTRLRIDERQVLDALIDGGIARSRSEALSWCVRLVGQHQAEWLSRLVEASDAVRKVREEGPSA